MNLERWLAIGIIGTIGTVLALIGVAGFIQVALLLWRGRRTTATVVADTSPVGRPQFQFTDENGERRVVSRAVSSVNRALGGGEQVPLIYLPQRPDTFVLDRFGDKWGVSLFLLFLGLIPISICLVLALGIEQQVMQHGLFPPTLFLVVGGFLAALAFPAAVKSRRFRRRGIKAAGIITEAQRGGVRPLVERARQEGRKILIEQPPSRAGEAEPHMLTVEFEDATGTKRQGFTEASERSGENGYAVGDQLPIVYDSERPWDTHADTFMGRFGPLLVTVVAAAMLVVGLCLLAGYLINN